MTASHYFPEWVSYPEARGPAGDRLPDDLDAEAIPFLVDSVNWFNTQNNSLMAIPVRMLPTLIQSKLPVPLDPTIRARLALRRLSHVTETAWGFNKVQGLFGTLPPWCQASLLSRWSGFRERAVPLQPLLAEAFLHDDPEVRWSVSLTALKLASITNTCFPLVLQHLTEASADSSAAFDDYWRACLFYLGELGSDGRAALPMLNGLTNGPQWRRVMARLTALRIHEPATDFRVFLEREVRAGTIRSPVDFLNAIQPLVRRSGKRCSMHLLPALTNLLSSRYITNLFPGPLSQQETSEAEWEAARALADLGAIARPAAPAVALWLQDPVATKRNRAAELLAGWGPVAPETLPALIEAMTHPLLHDRLIPLVGAYGPLATNALPVLQALADGQWREHGTGPANGENGEASRQVPGTVPRGRQQAAEAAVQQIQGSAAPRTAPIHP